MINISIIFSSNLYPSNVHYSIFCGIPQTSFEVFLSGWLAISGCCHSVSSPMRHREHTHRQAKHELLFLFGEYLAWQEELRRFVHRRSNYSWHMREARVVADAFSEPLESDRDPILKNISVGGEPELSSTADVSQTHQQDSLCSGPSTAWDRVKDFLRQ